MSKKAVASVMAEVASSSSHDVSPNVLAFPDCLNGGTVFLALVPEGILQPPKKLLAHIMHSLKFFKCHKWFFAHHRRQQALPPLGCVVVECSPCGRVRLMLRCVAFACQRLVTAPADMHMAHMSWSWAEVMMERVTRGRVKKVQETVAGFEAAAAARVVGGDDILASAENGDSVSVLCHVIADADSVNKRDDTFGNEYTPLHYSAEHGHLEVCRLLLQCNSNVEAKDFEQHTPLHLSARNGHLEVCRLLLQCNSDVEAKDCTQWTPLHLSALNGHLEFSREVCRLLLQCNADVDARADGQRTPLHYSAMYGHLEVTRLLVESKADVAARASIGDTVLTCAIDYNKVDVVAYLRSIRAPQ